MSNNIEDKKWPDKGTLYLIIPILQKGDLTKCSNYRTLSLISNSSNILLRIILNRLIPQTKLILSENQAGQKIKKHGRTNSKIRLINEKYIEKQKKV